MKIAVVGSREFKDIVLLRTILCKAFSERRADFVSGGARGVDTEASNFLKSWNPAIKQVIFKPEWDKYGKRAGFLRNELIINEADKIIAFWDGQSRGTKHSIDLAIKASKPIDIYVRS